MEEQKKSTSSEFRKFVESLLETGSRLFGNRMLEQVQKQRSEQIQLEWYGIMNDVVKQIPKGVRFIVIHKNAALKHVIAWVVHPEDSSKILYGTATVSDYDRKKTPWTISVQKGQVISFIRLNSMFSDGKIVLKERPFRTYANKARYASTSEIVKVGLHKYGSMDASQFGLAVFRLSLYCTIGSFVDVDDLFSGAPLVSEDAETIQSEQSVSS